MQDPGSVRVNQDHGSLASRVGSRVTSLPGRVGSRVNVADPVPSLGLPIDFSYTTSYRMSIVTFALVVCRLYVTLIIVAKPQ